MSTDTSLSYLVEAPSPSMHTSLKARGRGGERKENEECRESSYQLTNLPVLEVPRRSVPSTRPTVTTSTAPAGPFSRSSAAQHLPVRPLSIFPARATARD